MGLGIWLGLFNLLGSGVSNIVDTKKDIESYKRTYNAQEQTYVNSKGIKVNAKTQKPVFLETDNNGDQILLEAGGRVVKNYTQLKRDVTYKNQVSKYGNYITVKELPHKYDNTCIHNMNNGYEAIGNQCIDLENGKHYVCRTAYLPYCRVGSKHKGYKASFYMDVYSGEIVRLSDRDTYIECECKKQNKQHMDMKDVKHFINEYNEWHSTQKLNEINACSYYWNYREFLDDFMKKNPNNKFYLIMSYYSPIDKFDEEMIEKRKLITNE